MIISVFQSAINGFRFILYEKELKFVDNDQDRNGSGAELMLQLSNGAGIYSALFIKNERQLLSNCDNTLLIWDRKSGRQLRRIARHPGIVWGIVKSADERQVFTVCEDGYARQWELDSGDLLRVIGPYSPALESVVLSPSGRRVGVVTAEAPRIVELLGATTVWTPPAGQPRVTCLCFCGNDESFVTGHEDGSARVWSQTHALPFHLSMHNDRVTSMTFSPQNKLLLSTSHDGTARLWDMGTGALRHTLTAHSSFVTCGAISHDESLVATGGWDSALYLWDASTGLPRAMSNSFGCPVQSIVFSQDDQFVLAGSMDATIRLCRASNGRVSRHFRGFSARIEAAVMVPSSKRIFAMQYDRVAILDSSSRARTRIISARPGGAMAMAVSKHGERLLLVRADSTLFLYTLDEHVNRLRLKEQPTGVTAVALMNRDQHALVGDWNGFLRIWSLVDRGLIGVRHEHSDNIISITSSHDERVVLVASDDGTATVWEVPEYQPIERLVPGDPGITTAAISPDGMLALTGCGDNSCLLWRLAGETKSLRLQGHEELVLACAFSANGERILTGSGDATLRLWDTRNGSELRMFAGHTAAITSVQFLGNTHLLSSSADGTIRIWDVRTGECVLLLVPRRNGEWLSVDAQGIYDTSGVMPGRFAHLIYGDAVAPLQAEVAGLERRDPLSLIADELRLGSPTERGTRQS